MKRNKKMLITTLLGCIFLIGTWVDPVYACTGIRLIAKDKSVVYGRTMEWGAFDLNSRVTIIPRGYSFTGLTPDGENGKKWTAKYGVVGLDMLEKDFLADGVNEKGLAVGVFYHPGFASYPAYEKDMADNSITAVNVATYILTQFVTLDEVRQGMSEVRVVPVVEEAIGKPADAHWMVTSPEGECIVIEFTNGEMKVFDDPLGVITNAPTFDWHMINLRNYLNLSAVALPDKKIDDLDFTPLGGGSGMIGLPGDFTPPSRFVRAVAWTQTARSTPTSTETVYEAFRILDNFNVPLGASEGSDGPSRLEGMRSSTLWTSVWDLSNLVLYYHTMNNRRVRALDFGGLDFSNLGNEIIHMPLDNVKEQDIEYIKLKK
ncbi:MAG: choloylglycine hydrolase family protein [Bacteroidales bacterium]|nr:choloylglycine hydrolase family protein [Bacteroidota bacterium]MBL6949374.1 choloylglycine hydrolase family protein [Bacteroidales bacterium]